MPTYKAFSIHQPWVNLIRDGRKTIETRAWATPYRGELLLCSSLKPAIEPYGCAVCLVELIDCQPMRQEDWAAACIAPYGATAPTAAAQASPFARKGKEKPPPKVVYGWHLANIRPVSPVPVCGRLGIFSVALAELVRLR